MDTNTLYLIVSLTCLACVAYGIHRISAVKLRELDRKIADSRKMAAVRSGGQNSRVQGQNVQPGGIPAWLEDVAEQLGVEEYLDQDEMPPQLAKLLPIAKGFIESGGLEKLLKAGGGSGSTTPSGEFDETGGWH